MAKKYKFKLDPF